MIHKNERLKFPVIFLIRTSNQTFPFQGWGELGSKQEERSNSVLFCFFSLNHSIDLEKGNLVAMSLYSFMSRGAIFEVLHWQDVSISCNVKIQKDSV